MHLGITVYKNSHLYLEDKVVLKDERVDTTVVFKQDLLILISIVLVF